ncbi:MULTISPECIES: AbrB/MazE/SpoVT family DNA-binding domain-containing protein [unclassified Polynucleobacter]|uniref:AbrB/MazE/SpoVT family DNA-binding domain-containing protein n=1 Tax=unclassified Polynucleobacter TaxID=2640945 RepID=UPI002572BF58|nr:MULTISPECIES: antitoxin [unclassified Polynucleobacter]BEI35644.1 antitoxin [Polynucleobacter sp. HIN6]
MHTNLRKVGGSVMLAVSPVFLKELQITCGSTVDVALKDGQLVVRPIAKRKYELADLLAQCDPKAKMPSEDRQWLDSAPIGNEIL